MVEVHDGPAYKRLADQLCRLILDEGLQPEDELPSISEIQARWDYSDTVVRAALRKLDSDGVIKTRQGKRALILRRPDQPDERRSIEYHELKQLICDLRVEVAALRGEVDEIRQQTEGR
jgi:DNA-binding GntR family transcriptional regulator